MLVSCLSHRSKLRAASVFQSYLECERAVPAPAAVNLPRPFGHSSHGVVCGPRCCRRLLWVKTRRSRITGMRLIAAIKVSLFVGRLVVTVEVSKPAAQRANRKIPDVCNGLGLRWIDSFELIRTLDFSTSWRRA
ncbi:DUF4411 family protein [Mesorhizobium sp. NFR06]|uniref:DUF4411 family protein n=1 Tax=Mesorhizobium sp. NFR06 TaxID=1566290 RepID=UPI00122DA465